MNGLARRLIDSITGYFGTAPRSAGTTRNEALALLRGAARIFIAYTHDDLPHARDLRARLEKLRAGQRLDSIFLDQESLRPGQQIEPDEVDRRLEAAELVVVVCGKGTCRGTEVMREVRRALERSRAGGCSILPVILQPGARLPEGIDSRVQGIFLNHLFPRIARVRQLVAGSLAGLLIVAGFLVWHSERQARARLRAEIDLALREDERDRHPTNTSRRGTLERLAERAGTVGYRVEEIAALRDAAPPPDVRRELLPPRDDRQLVLVTGDGGSVVLGHAASIEVRPWRGGLGPPREISLGHLTPVPYDGARNPATLVSLAPHPSSIDVMVEVEYEGFAVPPGDDATGEATMGGERELFRLSVAELRMTSLGLTRALEWKIGHDLNGEENGPSWWELPDTTDESAIRAAHRVPDEFRHAAIPERSASGWQSVEFELLAADPVASACVFQRHHFLDPAAEMFQLGAGLRDVTTVATDGRQLWILTPTTAYYPEAAYLSFYDGPATYTSVLPQRWPAALHWSSHRAQLRDLFVEFGADEVRTTQLSIPELGDWSAVSEVSFDTEGEHLFVRRGREDACIVDPRRVRIEHRLVFPPDARCVAVTREGGAVLVVRRDGALDSWDALRFGADGWAAPAGEEIAPKKPQGAAGPAISPTAVEPGIAELPALEPIGIQPQPAALSRAEPTIGVIQGLTAALADAMPEVRAAALRELRRHVAAGEGDGDSTSGSAAARLSDDALAALLPALGHFLAADAASPEMDLSIELTARLGVRAATLTPQLIAALRGTTDAHRQVALLEALARVGRNAPEVVAAAGAALTRVPREGVGYALKILKEAGPDAREHLDDISGLLDAKDRPDDAIETWLAIDPDDPTLCARLLNDLADGRSSRPILDALPMVRPHRPADLAPLRLMLFAESEDERRLALEAVARLGSHAGELWPIAAERLGDEDESVRSAARDALRSGIEATDFWLPRVRELADAPYPVCLESIELLHAIGKIEDRHVARLGELLREADDPNIGVLLYVLGGFGTTAAPVAAEVARWLDEEQHREDALRCLAAIGPAARSQLPHVLALSAEVSWTWAEAFVRALCRLGLPLDEIVAQVRPLARRNDAGMLASWLGSEREADDDRDELLLALLLDDDAAVTELALDVLDERHVRLLPRILPGLSDRTVTRASVALEAVARIVIPARRDGAEFAAGDGGCDRLLRFLDPDAGFSIRSRGLAIALLLDGDCIQQLDSASPLIELLESSDTDEPLAAFSLQAVQNLRRDLPPDAKQLLLRITFDDKRDNETRTLALEALLATGLMPRLDDAQLRAFAREAARGWHHPWFALFEPERGVALYLPKVVSWLGGDEVGLGEVAVSTFRRVGEAGGFLVTEILQVMNSPATVVTGLGALRDMPEASTPHLAAILAQSRGAEESYGFHSFVEALSGLAIAGVLQIAEAAERAGAAAVELRLACYTASGGSPEIVRLMNYIARPPAEPGVTSSRERALDELSVLLAGYAQSQGLWHTEQRLERALAVAMRQGARAGFWQPADRPLVEAALQALRDRGSLFEPALREALAERGSDRRN